MKKTYAKPQISVESMAMDHPIAVGCLANFDDMEALIGFGYFGNNNRGITCTFEYADDGHDTVCYHSNVQTAFLS